MIRMVNSKPLKDFALSEDLPESVKINIFSLPDDVTREDLLRNLITNRKLLKLSQKKEVK
jgi:hypothetical protein